MPPFSHLWSVVLIIGLVCSVSSCEIKSTRGLAQCLVHKKGLMVSLILPWTPGRLGQLVTLKTLLTIAKLTSWWYILCCTSFWAYFPISPPPSSNNRVLSYFSCKRVGRIREWGGQNTLWRASGWKSLCCDIIYLPGEGRQKTHRGDWT